MLTPLLAQTHRQRETHRDAERCRRDRGRDIERGREGYRERCRERRVRTWMKRQRETLIESFDTQGNIDRERDTHTPVYTGKH